MRENGVGGISGRIRDGNDPTVYGLRGLGRRPFDLPTCLSGPLDHQGEVECRGTAPAPSHRL